MYKRSNVMLAVLKRWTFRITCMGKWQVN